MRSPSPPPPAAHFTCRPQQTHPPRPQFRPESNFLRLDFSEDVALKGTRRTEESLLGKVERESSIKAKHIHASYEPKTLVRRESSRWMPEMDDRTRAALDFIRKNFADPNLSVNQVVEVMGCSRSMADLLFRKSSGGSILDEIQNMRLENAYRLLRNPQQKIDSIPTLCGYRSEPFFKRLFKKKTGLTMREWRKQNVTQRA